MGHPKASTRGHGSETYSLGSAGACLLCDHLVGGQELRIPWSSTPSRTSYGVASPCESIEMKPLFEQGSALRLPLSHGLSENARHCAFVCLKGRRRPAPVRGRSGSRHADRQQRTVPPGDGAAETRVEPAHRARYTATPSPSMPVCGTHAAVRTHSRRRRAPARAQTTRAPPLPYQPRTPATSSGSSTDSPWSASRACASRGRRPPTREGASWDWAPDVRPSAILSPGAPKDPGPRRPRGRPVCASLERVRNTAHRIAHANSERLHPSDRSRMRESAARASDVDKCDGCVPRNLSTTLRQRGSGFTEQATTWSPGSVG